MMQINLGKSHHATDPSSKKETCAKFGAAVLVAGALIVTIALRAGEGRHGAVHGKLATNYPMPALVSGHDGAGQAEGAAISGAAGPKPVLWQAFEGASPEFKATAEQVLRTCENKSATIEQMEIATFVLERVMEDAKNPENAAAVLTWIVDSPGFNMEMMRLEMAGIACGIADVLASVVKELEATGCGDLDFIPWNVFGRAINTREINYEDLTAFAGMDLEAGKTLAVALGAARQKPYMAVIDYMHFAYGISAVGGEGATELYSKFGISRFIRYPSWVLGEVLRNMDPGHGKEKPVLVAVMNKNDWNGKAFVAAGKLPALRRYYRLSVIEAARENEAYARIAGISREYGKIDAFLVVGHGTPGSILLGEENEAGRLDLSDSNELRRIRRYFVERPLVILYSCSTGAGVKSMEKMMARVLGGKVYAPDSDITDMHFSLDGSGRIISVRFDEDLGIEDQWYAGMMIDTL